MAPGACTHLRAVLTVLPLLCPQAPGTIPPLSPIPDESPCHCPAPLPAKIELLQAVPCPGALLFPGDGGSHRAVWGTACLRAAHPLLLPPRKVTLLVVGLDNAGKSSVIMDIARGEEADFCWGVPQGVWRGGVVLPYTQCACGLQRVIPSPGSQQDHCQELCPTNLSWLGYPSLVQVRKTGL